MRRPGECSARTSSPESLTAGIHAPTIIDGADAAAVSQVCRHHAAGRGVRQEPLTGLGNVMVIDTVKAKSFDAELLLPFQWDGVMTA